MPRYNRACHAWYWKVSRLSPSGWAVLFYTPFWHPILSPPPRHVAQICSLMHMQLRFYKNTYTSTRLNTKQPHAITRVCGEISVKSFTSTEIAHAKQCLHSIYTTTHEAFLVFVRAISIWTNPSNANEYLHLTCIACKWIVTKLSNVSKAVHSSDITYNPWIDGTCITKVAHIHFCEINWDFEQHTWVHHASALGQASSRHN